MKTTNPRVTSCSNPQSVSGKYFINMKNEDVVILVNPNNNIFYCYTESEFQRILNEYPPFVLQGPSKVIAVERQNDPTRTFWVYNTQFGHVNKSLYDGYMAGARTFKMLPSGLGTQLIFKNSNLRMGDLHDYPAEIMKVFPIDRDALLSGKGQIVKDESIVVSEGKHQEIKETQDILPDEEDELFDENEIREYLEKSDSEKQEMLRVKREEKKKEEEELKKIQELRVQEMAERALKQKKQGGFRRPGLPQDEEKLFKLVSSNDLAGVKSLIESVVVDVNARDGKALNIACSEGYFEIVKLLIENGANVNTRDGMAVQQACVENRPEILRYLLGNGAVLDDSTFRIVCGYGYLDIVKIFVEKGILSREQGIQGIRGFLIASEKGRYEIVKYLVGQGVQVGAKNNQALRKASAEGHYDIVKLLIENKADIHADDDEALRSACVEGHFKIVQLLVENKANIHAEEDEALREACSSGNLDIVKLLVKHGANVGAKDNWALIWASSNGYLPIVKFLVENKADIHARDDLALLQACSRGHLEVVKYLVGKGSRNSKAIETAEQEGHKEIAEFLISSTK